MNSTQTTTAPEADARPSWATDTETSEGFTLHTATVGQVPCFGFNSFRRDSVAEVMVRQTNLSEGDVPAGMTLVEVARFEPGHPTDALLLSPADARGVAALLIQAAELAGCQA